MCFGKIGASVTFNLVIIGLYELFSWKITFFGFGVNIDLTFFPNPDFVLE